MKQRLCGSLPPILVLLLAAIVLGLAPDAAEAQMPPARVRVAKVQQREVTTGETFVGSVEPVRTSTVGSLVEGRVVEMLVNEGDQVRQGDPLAKLRTTQLEIELAGAQAELELRRQELAELENGTRPEEIEQARARMMAASALMDYTAAQLRRSKSLYERKAASIDELQEKESAAMAARQKYLETKAAWEEAVAGPRKEQIAKARASVAVQQESIRRLQDDISEHTIAAPFDGHVTAEHTEVGQWIAKGDPVAEVMALDAVEIEVAVLESYLPKVQLGASARVSIGALPGKVWEAPVVAIVPKADVRSRNFPVKVRLENPAGPNGALLKSGMFARVTLPVGDRQQALLVPKDAVVLGGQTSVVYAVAPMPGGQGPPSGSPQGPAPDGMARQVPVTLGASVDDWVEVRGPLGPDDRVVTVGNERLFPGRPLMVIHGAGPSGNDQ